MIFRDDHIEGKILYSDTFSDVSMRTLYKNLNEYFSEEEKISPALVLYSSYNKSTETKYIKDIKSERETAYLLFDIHLLDFLGEFTEIYIEEKHYLKLTRKLTYRALAESFYVKGKFHEALYCAYNYISSDGYIHFTKERNKFLTQSLLIQESFVLCHELSHWYLFRCNVNRDSLIENKKELWIEYLNKYIEKRKEKSDSNGVELLSEMIEYINIQSKIIEECTCDTFATVFLVNYMDGINQYNKIDIIKNSFIAIQSLQLLSFVEKYTDTLLGFQESNEKIYLELTIRRIIFKTYFGNYLEQYHKDLTNVFENEIVSCVERYSEHITNAFNDLLDEIPIEILRLKSAPEISFLDDSWETINEFIKELLYIDDR